MTGGVHEFLSPRGLALDFVRGDILSEKDLHPPMPSWATPTRRSLLGLLTVRRGMGRILVISRFSDRRVRGWE
jgi:hypothetical protein